MCITPEKLFDAIIYKEYKPPEEETVEMYLENILLICLQSSCAIGCVYPYMWCEIRCIWTDKKRFNDSFVFKLTN